MDTRTKKNKIIVISGTGFSATANENTVTFNLGAVGTVTSATTTELTITFSTQPTTTGSLTAVVENNIFNFDSGSAVQVADVDENTTIVEEFYIDKTVARSLNIHSNGLFLYCTSYDETEEKRQIDLYSINNSTGVLSLITSYVKDNPIQDMLISSDGINLYVNYVDNTIETYSIDSETGYLNLEDDFQIAGLASCIVRISPDLKNIYIASIQETYQTEMIYVYDRNLSTGIITEAETIAWLQDIGYLSNMIISDDGKHLYFRFFNDNTTGIFTRNLSTGLLTFNATQNIDIDFIKSNNIVFLRNTGGDNGLIDIYLRNTTNGSLSYSAQTGSVGNNNLLDVIQANEFAVVKNFDVIGGEIRAYSINPADGVLTFSDSFPTTPETAGSPFLLSSAQTPDNKFFYLSSVLVVGNPGTNEYSKITVFQL
jgi:6-phosphogluconolactonase (cycloisomerase 2 family)